MSQLVTNEDLERAGFIPYSGESSEVAPATIIATAEVGQLYKVLILSKSDDVQNLYLTFSGAPDWLQIPVEPTADALTQACAYYVSPGRLAPTETNYLAMAAAAAQGPTPVVHLSSPTAKRDAYFVGVGHYEDVMVDLENRLTLSGWTTLEPVAQATGMKDGGQYTQAFTPYSRTLLTLTRMPSNDVNSCPFRIEFQYEPTGHETATQQLIDSQKGTPVEMLSNELPLDVVGLVEAMRFEYFANKATFQKEAKTDAWFLMPLAFITSQDEFEDIFGSLAEDENIDVRDYVAGEAINRRNKAIFEKALAIGITDETRAEGESVDWTSAPGMKPENTAENTPEA